MILIFSYTNSGPPRVLAWHSDNKKKKRRNSKEQTGRAKSERSDTDQLSMINYVIKLELKWLKICTCHIGPKSQSELDEDLFIWFINIIYVEGLINRDWVRQSKRETKLNQSETHLIKQLETQSSNKKQRSTNLLKQSKQSAQTEPSSNQRELLSCD